MTGGFSMTNTAQIKIINDIGFAKTVLMPGDPLRAKMIAEKFLDDAVLVNNIRGIQGYTGYYKNQKVSVMASGMGIPSMGLYSYELFNFFGVENIIRIGTAGALAEDLKLRDVVIGLGANTNSNYGKQFDVNGTIAPTCSFELLSLAVDVSKEIETNVKVGNFYSTDTFYDANPLDNRKWAQVGSIAVEMESAGLYLNALKCNKRALAICTISDLPLLPDCPKCTPEEREESFTDMIKIALEVSTRID